MLVMKVAIFALFSVLGLASCSGGVVTFKFYVVLKPDEATKFIGAVAAIAKEDGLETATGQTAFDTGEVLRVVEGRGRNLKLWVQNIPLSGHEDPKVCGVYLEPHVDTAQFVVSTEPRWFGSKTAATQFGERILSQLQESGFDVRRKAAVCGAAVFHDRS